ncbi:MAG: hypothetical protein IPN25_03295 [Sphingobacteriales bacterium]|nr:hypothetical protein [Sphingobacteriales bacterium]
MASSIDFRSVMGMPDAATARCCCGFILPWGAFASFPSAVVAAAGLFTSEDWLFVACIDS